MNKQIYKIVEMAITQKEPDWPNFREAMTKDGSLYLHIFAEKFAELIVNECIEILSKNNPCPPGTTIMYSLIQDEYFDKGWQVAVETKSNQIKEHFGVEETQVWVCPKCGTDRGKAVCPKGLTAAVTGDCPMFGTAQ